MAKFYGIGVGPGDPELLTIKATRILSIIDVLLIPQTQKDEKGIAFTIMEPYLKEGIELVYIDFPMVVDEAVFNHAGEEASRVIQDRIQKNQNCAFVTLGDPSVYSTYGYIVKALKNSVTIETIPGITSFCAAAALANRPLVEKDELLTIIPMNASDEKIDAVLKVSNAFTFMKIYRREGRVIQHLKKYHMEADGVLVQRCGFPEAKVHTNVINSLEENKDYLTVVLSRKEEIK